MTEKKIRARGSAVPADENIQTKTEKDTLAQKKGVQNQKGFMDRCIENPGFPWMIIAILFTLLVIMFWKDHYYNYKYYKMRFGNIYYQHDRMMDGSYGPMREKGMRMYREKIEDSPGVNE